MKQTCYFALRVLLIWVLLLTGASYAGVPVVSPLDFDPGKAVEVVQEVVQEAHWIWKLLASEIVAVIAGWAYCYIQNRLEESRYFKAITVIKDAVTSCYHEYVRETKAANADGKLTIEEKNYALQLTYQKAVDFARKNGFDLLKVLAKDTVLRLIEKYVGEAKAPAVVGPLPDLEP